ncbi:hypothetical protein [Microvirga sp. TS319]|uniref:hypothetical protein n=1 Tax=Microvirga sp. TS319 TaxID=3241165 RepID=UPI003519FAC5
MRSISVVMTVACVSFLAIPLQAEAQSQRRSTLGQGRPLVLRVTPRSFLNPGNVVPVGSINPGYTGYGQVQSYLLFPPYGQSREAFGLSHVLPDPITNGPFVGARNPFGPIDYVAPPGLAR